MKNRLLLVAAAVAALASLENSSQAATVSVQFPAYSYLNGPNTQGGPNQNFTAGVISVNNWNVPTDFPAQRTASWSYTSTLSNLLDSTGATTNIGYSLNFNMTDSSNAQETQYGGYWPNVQWWLSGSLADVKLAQGGAVSYSYGTNSGTPTVLTITGLEPAQTYKVIAYVDGTFYADGSTAAVNLGSTTYYATTATNTLGTWTKANSTDSLNPTVGNYVEFTGLTGASSQTITVTGLYTGLSGFQVVAVPEPTSLSLLGLGTIALMSRRFRRK